MVAQHDAKRTVVLAGHIGMVSYGIVHLLIGWLAAQVALGGEDGKADQRGAVETIAEQPLGTILLILLVAGLVAFALWQLLAAFEGYTWVSDNGKRTRKRIGAAARGVMALAVSVYAVRLLMGAGQSGDEKQAELTARVMELPAGRVMIGLVALFLMAIGISRIRKGVKKKFVQNLDMSQLPEGTSKLTTRLGQVGYPAKGVAIGIVGILLGLAAFNRDPAEAGGLDKALHTLAAQPFGSVALLLVAVGLFAYGVYCFAAARSQRT